MSRIWVPRLKLLEAQDPVLIRCGLKGRYKMTVRNRHHLASVRRESPWFSNLLLDQGLNQIGGNFGGAFLSSAFVGTGTGAPAVGDTALGSLLATSNSINSVSATTASGSPYGAQKTFVFRFNAGVAEGNLTEVGVGNGSTQLFSRELIRDGAQDPTTFPVLSDEVLDVTYQINYYPPLGDVSGTISVTDSGNHDFTWRAGEAGNSSGWSIATGGIVPDSTNIQIAQIISNSYRVYDGSLGAITGLPSGSSATKTGTTGFGAYSNGNFYRDVAPVLGLTEGNVGGITAASFGAGSTGGNARSRWQCSFDPVIAKDGTNTLALSYRIAWARG